MDAAENLARLDDALRRAAADGVELTTAGTIDARQPEDMHRQVAIAPEREPGGFGFGAAPAAVMARIDRAALVNPAAAMVAIDTGGREIAEPFQMRQLRQIGPVPAQNRIGLIVGGYRNQHMRRR